MRKKLMGLAAIPAALILGAAVFAGPSAAHDTDGDGRDGERGHHMSGSHGMMGPGMMGYGMMGPSMMGYGMMNPGMMGYGYGYGAGPCGAGQTAEDKNLSIEDVTEMLQLRLQHWGNPRLKVGKVEVKDDDIIVAEIVTREGAIVDRIAIDRDSGRQRRVE